uniref:Nuclear pore membrane glycoprotein 210 n=2 Tax=Cacopsylla melanoneura TaxID=428564 RepID=A0A8D8XUE4_9HEMI
MKSTVILICFLTWMHLHQPVLASSKLNLPRVLLPLFSNSAANYTLEISDNGCYEWQLSRLDVIQIIPLDVSPSGCSSRALISTISRELTRNTVIVIAEDSTSGQTLRCDVIVDMIDSLHIVTKTRELYMEEAPEVFEVRAYDNQGNEFSTLDNVEFQWNIGTGGRIDQTVLRFMTFKDSPYETPTTVEALDEKGLKGHMVLLEGLKTGSAKVSVNLPYTEYRKVSPAEVNLMVVANLLIDPPDAYVLKGDTVKFRLLQLRHGRIVELSIPSTQYVFFIENESIAEAIDTRGNMLAVEQGRTKILLQYSNDVSIRLPHAFITVTEPQYLALSILPHRNWAVELDKTYTLVVDVYDIANRKFHLGDNARIEMTIPEEYFTVKASNTNGTQYVGYPIKTGVANVEALLRGIGSYKYDLPLFTREEMNIFSSVRVSPQQYILPWEENLKYQVVLKATGGDGSYSWSSSNQDIATVSQSGLVKTLGLGQVNISAAMTKNIHNKDSSRVVITRPTRLQIVDRFSLEAEVDKPIHLHVALYTEDAQTGREIAFTNCQQLGFKVTLENPAFHYDASLNLKENAGNACANLAILGSRIASSHVTVQYQIDGILLEDSAIVGTFNPLTIIQPERGHTVLAVGTSRHLVFSGGPSSKNLKKGTKKVDYDNSVVDIYDITGDTLDLYIYSVLCKRVGETNVKVVIGSCATADCKRSESISIVKVYCSLPKLVSFYFDTKSKDCPLKSEIDRISVLNYKDLNVTVLVKDSRGRTFDNATSLYAEWFISNTSLASVRYKGLVWLNASQQDNYLVPLNHFQVVLPRKKSGTLELTVKILHYRNVLLKKLNIATTMQEFDEDISATALIHFVEDTAVSKNNILLFNHPNNKGSIEVLPGSGHYKLTQSSDNVAQFVWDKSDKHLLRVIPISAGHVRLTIQDLCLQSHTTHINVEVRQVNSIRVEMITKIQKGKQVLAAVKLYDSQDTVLPISQTEFFDLNIALSRDEILEVKQHSVNVSRSEILFQVSGLDIGVSNLVFSTSFGQVNIYSQPLAVMVYPPLKIFPKHIVVPLNSKFHINAQGGPYPDCTYEFTSENETIKVLSNGLIEGVKLGSTKVTGMAVGYVKSNKNKVIFSKDTAEVTVVQLEGVVIHTPLLKFMQGTTLPLYVTGIPNELSPMVLSTLTPRLSFKWSVSSDIISITDVIESLGVHVRVEDRVSVRLNGLKPGKAIVYLKVFSSSSPVYTSSIQVEVFEDLFLLNPAQFRMDSLLLSPDTSYHLMSNKNLTHVKFSVVKNSSPDDKALTAVNHMDSKDIVSVSNKGVVVTHNRTGQAIINMCLSGVDEPAICKHIIVHVKPVHYVMLQVQSKLHGDPDMPVLALPQGMQLEFHTSFHDEFGQRFTRAKNELQVETSRSDLTLVKEIRNNSLVTDLALPGESVLRIWDESLVSKPKDYVKLSVDHLISPQKNHLVTGDVICFSIPKICHQGSWVSSHPDILAIDPDLGIGRARNKPGSVVISYELPLCGITASISVEVLLINAIHFMPTKNKTISNAASQSYKADLVLFNNYEATTMKSSNLISAEGSRCQNSVPYNVPSYPFVCRAKFVSTNAVNMMPPLEDIFDVEPVFSLRTGLYSCEFIPKSTTSNITLHKAEVSLKAQSVHGTTVSQPISLTFYPAPYVHTREIVFDKFRPALVMVSAYPDVLQQITVSASHKNYVKIETGGSGVPTSQPYRIHPLERIRTEPRSDLFIHVTSPLTQQTISIPIRLSSESVVADDESCMLGYIPKMVTGSQTMVTSGFTQLWIFLATLILGVVIVILVLEYFKRPVSTTTSVPDPGQEYTTRSYGGRTFPSNYAASPAKAAMSASSPLYPEDGYAGSSRRPFDSVSPVYGSPSPPSGTQRRNVVLPSVKQVVHNSSLDNSW